MENIKEMFLQLMEEQEYNDLTISKIIDIVNDSDIDEDKKSYIISVLEKHIPCEVMMKEDEEDTMAIVVSPYDGNYTIECERCNEVIVDLDVLLYDESE